MFPDNFVGFKLSKEDIGVSGVPVLVLSFHISRAFGVEGFLLFAFCVFTEHSPALRWDTPPFEQKGASPWAAR